MCIGTYRLTFITTYKSRGPIVRYEPQKTVIENPRGNEHRRMYMFVTSPIIMPFPFMCPVKTVVDLEGTILNTVLLPLRDNQKLDFMWRVGNAITDPIKSPYVIIFYGASGEEGKTMLALNISHIIGTGVGWMVPDLIRKASKWPDTDMVMELLGKRLIVCDECGIKDDMNYNNVKRWTSNAPVQSKGVSAYLSQTMIGITNKIGFSSRGEINNSIGRRVVVYKMDKELGKVKPFTKGSFTSQARIQFMAACIAVSNCYKRAPMSLEVALYTVFRRSVNHTTAGLTIDSMATNRQCREATAMMAIRNGVTIKRLVACFSAMSNRLVCEPEIGMPFVVGMRCMKFKLTPAGREYVPRNWGKEYLDLETLKMKSRII